MATSEHVQIARQGSLAIARWREEHPRERFDVSGANLSNRNLNRADLSHADLSGADLIGIHLNEANLVRANLREASCLMGHLSGADLSEAELCNVTLRGADLSGAIFSGANLTGANLVGANLSDANLENSVLAGANLSEAKLNGANLSRADLNRADFNNADLTSANLTGANLGKVTFHRTTLAGTRLNGAGMFHTVFGDCDLSQAIDLEGVTHSGPSAVSVDTMFRSSGLIPEKFLRGVGAPEDSVNYQRTITASADRFYTCFISYSIKDQAFTERLQDDLQTQGVRCWYFPADSLGGNWVPRIASPDEVGLWIGEDVDRGIRYYDKLIVVCSGDSLASERIRDEIIHGVQKQSETGRWLFSPVAISDAAYDRRNRYVRGLRLWRHVMFDFRGWEDPQVYRSALDRLIQDLNRDQEVSVGMSPVEEEEED